jgi:hypothetical protein
MHPLLPHTCTHTPGCTTNSEGCCKHITGSFADSSIAPITVTRLLGTEQNPCAHLQNKLGCQGRGTLNANSCLLPASLHTWLCDAAWCAQHHSLLQWHTASCPCGLCMFCCSCSCRRHLLSTSDRRCCPAMICAPTTHISCWRPRGGRTSGGGTSCSSARTASKQGRQAGEIANRQARECEFRGVCSNRLCLRVCRHTHSLCATWPHPLSPNPLVRVVNTV